MASPSPAPRKRIVRLPQSSVRTQKQFAHLKLLNRIHPLESPIAFEGKLLAPGANISVEDLPEHPVIIECVGPVGTGMRREILWILWAWDWPREEWHELARSQSVNSDWTLALREPAIRALHPERELQNTTAHWQSVSSAIMQSVDGQLELEVPEVKLYVLHAVYDQVAGRIAQQMAA